MARSLIPVVLSGGSGTRLWPVSRELEPKPFMRLADGESLIQKALLRAKGMPGVTHVVTVTNKAHAHRTHADYLEISADPTQYTYLLEPSARNTAPAIAAAALEVAATKGDDALMLILPADHLIEDEAGFVAAVRIAMDLADTGRLVTFGIKPTRADTGFGYIEFKGNEVTRFVEKPPLDKAKEFLAAGNFCWNAGMFCFRAGTLIDEMDKHAPELLAAVRASIAAATISASKGYRQLELDAEAFSKADNVSIDYALMEKSSKIAVVECDVGWNDVGSWNAVAMLRDADEGGNRVVGAATLHDTKDCYLHSGNRMIATVGVSDLIIVDTPDAVLVAHQDRAQDVKHIVKQLTESRHPSAEIHLTAHRPWGTYTVLEDGEHHKIKRIVVKPGGTLSLQMHHHRSEHWVVVDGTATVVNGEQEMTLRANQSTYIPAGQKHRLSNLGDKNLVLIEVQTGNYLGEDDIIRFEDIYGRSPAI
jgi:mannose-1-phosphate guanylyltransferase / mannose-6-phosphate isomerase